MKSCLTAVLTIFVFSLSFGQFQPTTVVKSEQIIRYQGANYYLHSIKEGQTMYRICKVYGVSPQDIEKANPETSLEPLPIGLALKIPIKGHVNIAAENNQSNQDQILHTVKAQETVYSLSRKYNVPINLIYQHNPGSENGLKIGQVVKIPKQNTDLQSNTSSTLQAPVRQDQTTQGQEPFFYYKVKPGDTLYRLSKFYHVSISDLISLNEDLRWGLKADQILKIPNEDYFPEGYSYFADHVDSVVSVMDFKALTRFQCDSIQRQNRRTRPIKLAVLLPFFAEESFAGETQVPDSLAGHSKNRKAPFKGRVATEIYEGLLLAVDTLSKQGYNISLAVYDTEGDTNHVADLLRDLDIFEPDIIIGPLAPNNIRKVSQYSFERKIPMIPPLATEDYLFSDNPFIFRMIPSKEHEQRALAKFLANMAQGKNLILAYKNSLKYTEDIAKFKKIYLSELLNNPSGDTLQLTEVFIDDSLQFHLEKSLHPEKENIALVYSTYEADVISALARLHQFNNDYEIRIVGMPVWQKFQNIRIDVIHELQVSLLTPFYINYDDEATKQFILKCREKLNYEPYKTTSRGTGINYTFLGYDLGLYFVQNALRYNRKLCDCAEYSSMDLLLSNYNFIRNPETGNIENTSYQFLLYADDYSVLIINKVATSWSGIDTYPEKQVKDDKDEDDIILYRPN